MLSQSFNIEININNDLDIFFDEIFLLIYIFVKNNYNSFENDDLLKKIINKKLCKNKNIKKISLLFFTLFLVNYNKN